jgi:transcriptional antiterminator RfaH
MTLHWYAIYTKHNSEQALQKCISDYSQINGLNYATYLPLREEVKQWRDRTRIKKVPLFRNYIFVRHDDNAFHQIVKMKGVCDYVRFGPQPSKISTEQMEMIQKVVKHQSDIYSPPSKFVKGTKVEITKGALAGYQGVLLEDQSNNNLAVEIKSLKLFFNIKVPKDALQEQ